MMSLTIWVCSFRLAAQTQQRASFLAQCKIAVRSSPSKLSLSFHMVEVFRKDSADCSGKGFIGAFLRGHHTPSTIRGAGCRHTSDFLHE